MSSRPFASATIVLGKSIRIPVKLHATVGDPKPAFVRAHAECGTKASMQFWCPACGRAVGKETFGTFVDSGGRLLPLTAEDLAEIEREPKHRMAALECVPLKTVPRYGALASYFLTPDAGAERAFALLARVLWANSLGLVIRWDGRGGERLAVLYSPDAAGAGRPLICEVRPFGDDVRPIDDVPAKLAPAHLGETDYRALRAAVMAWERGAFDPAGYRDSNRKTVARVVNRVVERELVAGPEGLAAALKASVAAPVVKAKKKQPKTSARKSAKVSHAQP